MREFELGGAAFRPVESERSPERSRAGDFVIVKDEAALRFYESLRPHLPLTIMEIGMFEGGSLVYFDKLFRPSRLVGVDRRVKPIEALEDYRKTRPHIETYYARFQDKAGVLQAARRNFPKGLDLVVDDASHLYFETRATFDMLFPLVREGGHYVIERWRGPKWMRKGEDGEDETAVPASKFVFELMDQIAETPAIESVTVRSEIACVRKGPGPYTPRGGTIPPLADSDASPL